MTKKRCSMLALTLILAILMSLMSGTYVFARSDSFSVTFNIQGCDEKYYTILNYDIEALAWETSNEEVASGTTIAYAPNSSKGFIFRIIGATSYFADTETLTWKGFKLEVDGMPFKTLSTSTPFSYDPNGEETNLFAMTGTTMHVYTFAIQTDEISFTFQKSGGLLLKVPSSSHFDNITLTAVFEPKESINNTPTVVSNYPTGSENPVGIKTLSFVENAETGGSYWTLDTNIGSSIVGGESGDCVQLAYIQAGDDESTRVYSEDGQTITWLVTEDLEYTAYFEPRTLHVRAGSLSVFPTLYSSGVRSSRPSQEVFEGQRVGFYFEAFAPQGYYVWNSSAESFRSFGTTCTLYAGEGTDGAVLASYSRNEENLGVNSYPQRLLTADPLPAGLTKVTIALQIEDGPVWTETFDVAALQAGSAPLRYQDVPGKGLEYGHAADEGPAVYDATAYVDEVTGAATVYLSTNGGVAVSDGGAYTIMPGLSSDVVAMGGESADALYAIGVETEYITPAGADYATEYARHFVYQLTNGSWSKIDNTGHDILSVFGVADTAAYIGLVMNGSSIWLQDAHWNGAEWVDNDVAFNTFWKADAETAYAGSAQGLYRYQDGEWTQVSGTSGKMFIMGGCRTASGVKLTVAAQDFYDVRGRVRVSNALYNGSGYAKLVEISGESVTVSEIDVSSIAEGSDKNTKYVGLASDGTLYLLNAGRLYANQSTEVYIGSNVYQYVNGAWQNQIVEEFNDPLYEDDDPDTKYRPDNVRYMVSPCDGVTFFLGDDGAIYLLTEDVTVTFDAQGGVFRNEELATLTAPILSEISSSLVPTVTKEDKSFGGWYYDAEGTAAWTPGYMPAKSITLYAKWNEKDVDAELQAAKDNALAELAKQFNKYSADDYSAENWTALETAYNNGIAAINAAGPGTEFVEDNVTAALNAALEAMQAIPADNAGKIQVAVSMDANTLGLGYLIKPTLVTVDKYEQVSVVIAELIEQMAAEKFDVTGEGLSQKGLSEPEGDYPWVITGSPEHDFYLAQVFYPAQQDYQITGALNSFIISNNIAINSDDASGRYLGEFDYTNTAGWMYSVGNKTDGGATFAGTGASGWSLMNGDVVRWQFTLVGYGADLGADNTEWGANAILNPGDKSALTWEVATLRSQYSDATLKTYDVYNAALAVLTNAEAEQSAIDTALADLNGLVIPVPQEIPDEKIDITGEDTNNAIAEVVSEIDADGTAILHVTAANPCVVVVEKADGTYERLTAVQNADGGYDFSQEGYTEAMKFHVLLKGDADGNGKVNTIDAMQIVKACLSTTNSSYVALSDLTKTALGTINTNLAMQIVKSCLSATHEAYLALTW